MKSFAYVRSTDVNETIAAALSDRTSAFIAGGTGIVDLMQDAAETGVA